jgi:ribonuclease HI
MNATPMSIKPRQLSMAAPKGALLASASHRVVTDAGDALGWALVGDGFERFGLVLSEDLTEVEAAVTEAREVLGEVLLADADKDRTVLDPVRRPLLKGLGWHRVEAPRVTRAGVSRGEHGDRARELAKAAAEAHSELNPLRVATDASVPRTGQRVGTGWVSADGRTGAWSGGVEVGAVRTSGWAELLGVLEVFKAHRDEAQHLVVTTDSREAVTAVAALRAGTESVMGVSVLRCGEAAAVLATNTRAEVRWVKGHAGEQLNEAAHRLALAAGREATREQHAGALAAVRANLVLELA